MMSGRSAAVHLLGDDRKECLRSEESKRLAAPDRPEMRFSGIDDLVARIKTDVGIARSQLEMPEHQVCRAHECFLAGDR